MTAGNTSIDTEYIILKNIYDTPEQDTALRQRDLAQIAGASLGMTNSILKRLAQKGWITIKKLNSRNIRYAITIDGINEIIHRSYRYFKRTIQDVMYFKDILEDLVVQAKRRNIKTVMLIGRSDLDFIIEHAARRIGLDFLMFRSAEEANGRPNSRFPVFRLNARRDILKIYAEDITPEKTASDNVFYLSRLIIKQAAAEELTVHGL